MTPAEERFEAIAIAHGHVILAYLARRTAPDEDASDVYQEVLTTAWRKIHVVPDDSDHALAWLLTVARRALSNHRRSHTRRLAATDRLAAELATSAPAHGESSPALDSVRDALASLERDDREILTLTYWEGLTAEQVAIVFGISAPAARKRLQRARDRLSVRVTRANEPDARARSGVVELASGRGGRR
jgi:RNA polymerase sigma-70 factor (ECF subfamily)